MGKKIIELQLTNPDLKAQDMIDTARKAAEVVYPDTKSIWVAYSHTFIMEDNEGNRVMATISASAKGFDEKDYEGY